MKAWKTSGLIVLLVWIAIAAIIWFRNVDGAGVAQTAQLKEITLLIWLIFCNSCHYWLSNLVYCFKKESKKI